MKFNEGDSVVINFDAIEDFSGETGYEKSDFQGPLTVIEVDNYPNYHFPYLVSTKEGITSWFKESEIEFYVEFTDEEVEFMIAANTYAFPLE